MKRVSKPSKLKPDDHTIDYTIAERKKNNSEFKFRFKIVVITTHLFKEQHTQNNCVYNSFK